MGRDVVAIDHAAGGTRDLVTPVDGAAALPNTEGTDFISTMPMRELVDDMDPALPAPVVAAADALRYRDFLTVALMVRQPDLFPDNWIYIHEPAVKVGRIQNFKNWSPDMVPDPATSCLGLEYFCFEGDGLWTSSDADLVELAKGEMGQLGLLDPAEVFDGSVVRQPKAYPVYDDDYLRAYRDDPRPPCHRGAQPGAGRAQRDAPLQQPGPLDDDGAAGRASRSLGSRLDPWKVNTDAEYHEEARPASATGQAACRRRSRSRFRAWAGGGS